MIHSVFRTLALAAVALALTGCSVLEVLLPPAEGPNAPSRPPASGAPAAKTLVLDGLVHRATRARPVKRVAFPVPPGSYRSVALELTVVHGGWSSVRPGGTHNLFWLARDRNRDLFGYANVRNRRDLFIRYGIGIPQGQKARVTGRAAMAPGQRYRVSYLYDGGGNRVELVVREKGRELARLAGKPDQREVRVRAGQKFLIDLGFTGTDNPNEPASLGWEWHDLRAEVR